jgi:hypothetical protein
MALDYLIGADGPQRGKDGRITETPFEEGPAERGPSIAYCNLRREDGEPREFGPYLPHDDIFAQFGEGRPDPAGPGFLRNIVEQLDRCKALGHTLVEEDNPDSYPLPAVMRGVELAQQRGLGVIAKNAGLLGNGARAYVAHPNVLGIIVEKDCGTPAEMDQLRRSAGKPDLPVWFVSFGDGRDSAARTAQAITAARFANMGVTFSREGEYESSEDVLAPFTSVAATQLGEKTMPDTIPPHLTLARSQIGKIEDGPSILPLAAKVGQLYPDMAGYCQLVTPTTAWCGLFCGHDLAVNGVRPPYNPKVDVQSFLFARAWLGFGTPVPRGQEQLGDILIFDFGGGDSHVTFLNGESGSSYQCLGGNQSDQVKVSNFPKSQCIGIRRAPTESSQSQQLASVDDPAFRPMLQKGAMGPDVSELQRLLGIEADGEFGPDTDAAVRAFQASHGLEVDGEVGPQTWASLLSKTSQITPTRPVTPGPIGTLTQPTIDRIVSLARNSPLARVNWPGRGSAPVGYINGVAVTFARAYLKLKAGDSAALVMTGPIGASTKDAFAWYGLPAGDRPSMLRQLFALLYGLGMRESSGNCFEGRDHSATNVEADTAEAGLFQQSWNSHVASPELPKLFEAYSANPDGFLPIFREQVPGSPSPNFGAGPGAAFQALCKSCPAFAVEFAAVGLRTIGGGPAPPGHWGPIGRREAQIRPEAEQLLQQVQDLVDSIVVLPPPPPPPPPLDQAGNPLQMLILILMMLAKEKLPMATDLTKPGQGIDFIQVLVPLLLQSIQSGKQIDISQLLVQLLSMLLTGKPLATPAAVPMAVAPSPPATQQPTDLNALLLPLLIQVLSGKPLQGVTLPNPSTSGTTTSSGAAETSSNVIQKPSVQLSMAGLALTSILQAIGTIGTPFALGQAPTTAGTLATLVPILTGAFGATGGFGSLLNLFRPK